MITANDNELKEHVMTFAKIRERQRKATTPLEFLHWSGLVDYKPILSAMRELVKSGKIVQMGRDIEEGTCFVIPDRKFISIKRGNGDNNGKRSSP